MAEEVKLRISFRDETVDLKAQITSESQSPHTGRPLREAQSEVTIPADRSDEFQRP